MNIIPTPPPEESFVTTVEAAQRIWRATMYEADRGGQPVGIVILYAPDQDLARVWIGGKREEAG